MARTLESLIEDYLLQRCREAGFLCLKFVSPGRGGVPDRAIITPAGTVFVEVKRPGEKPTKLQLVVHEKMRRYGGAVYLVDSKVSVDLLMTVLSRRAETWPA